MKKTNNVKLGSQKVGNGQSTYFIAEIGNNHNGDFYLAKRSIEEAARAGAHAVKFQKRSIKDTFAKELRDKPQTKNEIKGKTYGEYRAGLEFTLDEFIKLKEISEANKVDFFATPFDIPSVDFLEKVNIPFYKIASFDVTNIPLIEHVAKIKKPIILSTGMSTLEEVDEAINTVLKYHDQLVLLYCVSVYPSPDEHINLGTVRLFKKKYENIPIGYSGHESDILPTLAAIAQGATVIERHFTLSRSLPGPDHATVSIEPATFKEMVENARRINLMNGREDKDFFDQEKVTRAKHGKSIVAKVRIPKGKKITAKMLVCKSPGYGINPRDLGKIIGKTALVNIPEDKVILPEELG